MANQLNITLSNGVELELDPEDLNKNFSMFIDKFLIPYFKESNDWNKTIISSISEIERISSKFDVSKGEIISKFLKNIESRLPTDIAELTGLDKIEILFENIDDYVESMVNIVSSGDSQEDIRLKIAKLVENLNLFELSELFIHFAKNKK
ncbi:hypothetical protein DSAG12_02062 [Promethearchaeum syntrophicum]|uniref:Uncharacterized protein n=1 Tax=Promethearchaeum syntrophicum TaxID=2594042 RepID=A0A5B9DAU9_9ARCH|nr:hypothetical protein [Candidatus Prometheoarchaeum syntrophicum]QEE16232.1 hypothetical protein DSAG12_02062 [Candidatus Prometheoarchaeum syntrophicum]